MAFRRLLAGIKRRVRPTARPPELEWLGEGWPRNAVVGESGWNSDQVAETQLARWILLQPKLELPSPLGLAPISPDDARNSHTFHSNVMTFAYVLARTALHNKRPSLLDWGGGIGQYLHLAEALLPEVSIDYTCRDFPGFCSRGGRLAPRAAFFTSDDQLRGRTFDLVMASGSLQYVENWIDQLQAFANFSSRFVYVTRLALVEADTYAALHRPYGVGYDTEYAFWCLSRTAFLRQAERVGLELMREFLVDEPMTIAGAPAQPLSRGFLFQRAP